MERTPGEAAEASLPLDDAASACIAACAETAQAVDEPTEEPTFEERVARVRKTLHSRGSFTEIMRKTLVFCETRRSIEDVEREMATYPEFRYVDQSQRNIVAHLVNAGGLDRFELDQDGNEVTPETTEGLSEDEADELVCSYALQTTDAGKAAADELEPKKRLSALLDSIAARKGAYLDLLEFCREPRTYQAVADAMKAKGLGLKSTNALSSLPVHPSALLAKLESTGGLVWDEGWKLTSAGAAALKAAGRTV